MIVQSTMAEQHKPIQKPFNIKLNLKASVYPIGIDINQYAIKLDNNIMSVCFIPLHIPASEICSPSNI